MGDETKINLRDGCDEAAMLMYGAIDQLPAATKIRPKGIRILIINCGILNTTPSLSAMIINHYKLSQNIEGLNRVGMGCAAGIIAIDLAKDLLAAYPGSYAVVLSTEVVSSAWYDGKERHMLLPNCFFRMGAAAMLLSNHQSIVGSGIKIIANNSICRKWSAKANVRKSSAHPKRIIFNHCYRIDNSCVIIRFNLEEDLLVFLVLMK